MIFQVTIVQYHSLLVPICTKNDVTLRATPTDGHSSVGKLLSWAGSRDQFVAWNRCWEEDPISASVAMESSEESKGNELEMPASAFAILGQLDTIIKENQENDVQDDDFSFEEQQLVPDDDDDGSRSSSAEASPQSTSPEKPESSEANGKDDLGTEQIFFQANLQPELEIADKECCPEKVCAAVRHYISIYTYSFIKINAYRLTRSKI